MKKALYILAALTIAAFSFTSCNKAEEDDAPVSIVGKWKYWGASTDCEVSINIITQQIFEIDDSSIRIYEDSRIGGALTEEYSYSRKGNIISFTPSFLGKFDTAEVVGLVHPAGGISINCSEKSEYVFAPVTE